ncbi:NnrU family protein in cluster with Mesaconyl-CoA hydratase [Candidatus Rhodobacter oscarellae]|uniref:NnrU family protein in cluster with Mesaconyl-CoA hydratase n=1 Tax=Candidatus Rhodobacter oscarellae TaxID=1675527 RepID=A0A0J9E5C9_9RHOB|nr:NnrU family protein [Candidatus Rhodobacter lobularis]KMW57957.1 NnrU family protein in cluster with Mesaconyl-CoA hydratase [Candidatus Rhodobacter lobularis]
MLFLMILGGALWAGAHAFKRLAPEQRLAMGARGKGPVALAILASIVLMVVGYWNADYTIVYDLPGAGHLVLLLMLPAIALLGLGSSKSRLWPEMRHPMLTGFALWCGLHLLANGDSSSILLFGGLGAWAVAQMWLINRGTGWALASGRKPGSQAGDIRLAVITLVVYAVLIVLHIFLIKNPFTG